MTIPGECPLSPEYSDRIYKNIHLIRDFQEFAGVSPSSIESELLKSEMKFFNRLFY